MIVEEDVWPEAEPPADDHPDFNTVDPADEAGASAEGGGLGRLRATERAARLKKAPSAFRTISEVADDLHVPQHVLRFWETRFPQVKPLKRGGGRRYYRPDDVVLLRRIAELLYVQGYTIKGVQRVLVEGDEALQDEPPALSGVPSEASSVDGPLPAARDRAAAEVAAAPATQDDMTDGLLREILSELEAMRRLLPGR